MEIVKFSAGTFIQFPALSQSNYFIMFKISF